MALHWSDRRKMGSSGKRTLFGRIWSVCYRYSERQNIQYEKFAEVSGTLWKPYRKKIPGCFLEKEWAGTTCGFQPADPAWDFGWKKVSGRVCKGL